MMPPYLEMPFGQPMMGPMLTQPSPMGFATISDVGTTAAGTTFNAGPGSSSSVF